MKFDESIRNNTKIIGEKIKDLKQIKELNDRFVELFENPKEQFGFCMVNFDS